MMNPNKTITRRRFMQQSAYVVGAAVSSTVFSSCGSETDGPLPPLPTRTLGKTGLEVSMLSFGSGSQFLKNEDGDWELMLQRALDLGINLFDTSSTYKWGASLSSEERLGQVLPPYRDKIILSTKVEDTDRNVDACLREVETSLSRMNTDYLDLLLIHSIEANEDIAALESGLYMELVKLKEQGVARFIGFSSMNSAEKSRELMEKLEVDVAILAMNPTQYGDFAEIALPVAREKNIGVLAMKVMRDLVGEQATARELLHYALSFDGVATALVGHFGEQTLEENVLLVKEIADSPLAAAGRHRLERRLAHCGGPHHLCWAHPDYYDGMIC